MSNTNSWAFPNMIDVTANKVNLVTDEKSVVNRDRLLMLTEPTELYMNPNFGVGLKRYLWQYNTPNTKAILQDRIKDQLELHEPCVEAQDTKFSDLMFTEEANQFDSQEYNKLKMSVGLVTDFGGTANIYLDDEIVRWTSDTEYTNTDELALRDE